jgi:hypothetical protein
MKTAIILHGKPSYEEYSDPRIPSPSNNHWLPWLQKQLLLKGFLAQTPELPAPYAPVYEGWRLAFEQFRIDEDTALIGHSCGAGFLLRWLSENKITVGKVALVAPFLDPNRNKVAKDFFLFQWDRHLAARAGGINVFFSSDDGPDILNSVASVKASIDGIEFTPFTDRGHFILTETFPELLRWLL